MVCPNMTNVGRSGQIFNLLTPVSDQDKNFSLQQQYNIRQACDENEEKYQLGDYKLIQHEIIQTNITRTVWQTVRRITNEILGVKGLNAWQTEGQNCDKFVNHQL